MYLLVKCARIIVSSMHKNRSSMCNGLPKALLGNTSAGQCHRYSGYEIAPSHWETRLLLRSLKKRGHTAIEPIKITVDSTGRSALDPGKAVVSSNFSVDIAMPVKPTHGKNLFFQNVGGTNSSSAPNPSSQARVGSE